VIVLARGTTLACPVALLQRFLGVAQWAEEMPLFRDYDGHQARRRAATAVEFKAEAVSYSKMRAQVLKYVGKVLGVSEEEAKSRFGLHSLRSGGASAVAAEGVDERLFQAHGGWRSREAMMPYLKDSVETKMSVTAALGY
jgi:hypothetical protein